jgi:hypothetical protein
LARQCYNRPIYGLLYLPFTFRQAKPKNATVNFDQLHGGARCPPRHSRLSRVVCAALADATDAATRDEKCRVDSARSGEPRQPEPAARRAARTVGVISPLKAFAGFGSRYPEGV